MESIQYSKTRSVTLKPEVMRANHLVMALPNDPRADVFRVLRTRILRQLRLNGWTSFAVTSVAPGAGKTFVSINLAMALAMEGNQSILLVDADLRRPAVAPRMGLSADKGLVDYLENDIPLETTLIHPGIERLVVLPGRDTNVGSSELIASSKMARLVDEMKQRYASRIIIFDIPPLCAADDVLLLTQYVDAVLLVVEDEKDTDDELETALQALENSNLLGLVLNKAKSPMAGQNYQSHYANSTSGPIANSGSGNGNGSGA